LGLNSAPFQIYIIFSLQLTFLRIVTLSHSAIHDSDEAMTVINTNVEALKAQLAGNIAAKKLDTASNRLASGIR
jgi:hypothetical protein